MRILLNNVTDLPGGLLERCLETFQSCPRKGIWDWDAWCSFVGSRLALTAPQMPSLKHKAEDVEPGFSDKRAGMPPAF